MEKISLDDGLYLHGDPCSFHDLKDHEISDNTDWLYDVSRLRSNIHI